MIDDSALEHDFTEAVLRVNGVVDIYPVAPALLAAAGQALSALTGQLRSAQSGHAGADAVGRRVVEISRESSARSDGGAGSASGAGAASGAGVASAVVTIRAHIAVDSERAVPDVTRDVSDTLEAEAARALGPDASVSICVKVSSIG